MRRIKKPIRSVVLVICTLSVGLFFMTAHPTSMGGKNNATTDAILFEGAQLIVGDGNDPIENSAFVVENQHFTQVGKAGELTVPEDVKRVDLSGKTVMPAIIDTHVHLGTAAVGQPPYSREKLIDGL